MEFICVLFRSKRRRLFNVSYAIVILPLVSTEAWTWRLDGSRKPTTRNRARTIASEIRSSLRRVIQVLQGRARGGTGRRPAILARKPGLAQPPPIKNRDG